jgi:hypothetical protein
MTAPYRTPSPPATRPRARVPWWQPLLPHLPSLIAGVLMGALALWLSRIGAMPRALAVPYVAGAALAGAWTQRAREGGPPWD